MSHHKGGNLKIRVPTIRIINEGIDIEQHIEKGTLNSDSSLHKEKTACARMREACPKRIPTCAKKERCPRP